MNSRFIRHWLLGLTGTAVLLAAVFVGYLYLNRRLDRIQLIRTWFEAPTAYADWQIPGGALCPDGVMLWPSSGFVGVGWGDGTPPVYQHTGYDIFSPDGAENTTPIFAAYDGYLTREQDWVSTVIIRHPAMKERPTGLSGELWTYYTHMASADGQQVFISQDFPPGTYEKFVTAGTLLGFQGTWSGNPDRPVGLHLHFSVVQSLPGGGYANETFIANTLDPALFLGTEIGQDGIIRCRPAVTD